MPLAGLRRPVKRSLRLVGRITISNKVCFALSRPAANEINYISPPCAHKKQ